MRKYKPDVGISLMPRRDRPVITAAIPQQDDGEVTSVALPGSKPAARRMNPLEKRAAVQEAILFQQHPHMPLKQIAVQHGLEPKALSRPYAKKLLQAMLPDRDRTPKDQAEDFLYQEKRRKG